MNKPLTMTRCIDEWSPPADNCGFALELDRFRVTRGDTILGYVGENSSPDNMTDRWFAVKAYPSHESLWAPMLVDALAWLEEAA